jgi:hypothetical protein
LAERERAEDMSGEDAAWRDLVARFDLPGDADGTPPPWPAREDLLTARHGKPLADAGTQEASGPGGSPESGSTDIPQSGDAGGPEGDDDQPPGDKPGTAETAAADRTRVIKPAVPVQLPAAAQDEDEHYIPPPPPPLPALDPVAKGAWAALFGGPAFLLIATTAGWVIPGWATFGAVAAFVGGFAFVIIRMGDKPSRGSGPDNGAVL